MKTKILFLGSRQLGANYLKHILNNSSMCTVVAAVIPTFKGWWTDDLENIIENFGISKFYDINDCKLLDFDIILSVNYWKLIDNYFINRVKGRVFNVHHSYLMRFRGRHSTSWAIMHARKDNYWVHGTSIHLVTSKLDDGPIIATASVRIEENDTAASLFAKVEKLSLELFENSFHNILSDNYKIIKADEKFYYYSKEAKDQIRFDDCIRLDQLYDYCRAWTMDGVELPEIKFANSKIQLKLKQE